MKTSHGAGLVPVHALAGDLAHVLDEDGLSHGQAEEGGVVVFSEVRSVDEDLGYKSKR